MFTLLLLLLLSQKVHKPTCETDKLVKIKLVGSDYIKVCLSVVHHLANPYLHKSIEQGQQRYINWNKNITVQIIFDNFPIIKATFGTQIYERLHVARI